MKVSGAVFPLAAFFVPLGVRLIPEILAYPYPIGFDTIAYYVPIIMSRIALVGSPVNYFGGTILLYLPLTYVYLLVSDALLVMKLAPTVLLGLLGWSTFLLGRKLLSWNRSWALFLALVGSLYFVALRLSWDLHRNVLGLALVLLTLGFLAEEKPANRFIAVLILASLAVMTHESSAVLVAIVAIVHLFTNGRYRALKEWAPFIPAGALLIFQVLSSRGLGAQIQETALAPNFFASFSYNLSFFVFAFGFILPVAAIGLRVGVERRLAVWALVSLIFGLIPNVGIQTGASFRWIMLLTMPLIVLFVQGIRVLNSFRGRMPRRLGRFAVAVSLIAIVVMSSGYVGFHGMLQDYFRLAPEYRNLMPLSMIESAISINDIPSVFAIAQWANSTLDSRAALVLPFQLYGWYLAAVSPYEPANRPPLDQTRNLDEIMSDIKPRSGPDIVYARAVDLYIPNDRFTLVDLAYEVAAKDGRHVYVVWWKPNAEGSTFGRLPDGFVSVFISDRLAVFKLE